MTIIPIPDLNIKRENPRRYKIANTVFQYWWSIAKRFYKVKDKLVLSSYKDSHLAQIKHARFFSNLFKVPLGVCGIGDSNWENMSSLKFMLLQYEYGISVNIAKGGTRSDTWNDYFNEFPDMVEWIKLFKIQLFNIGGNNVLQDQMKVLKTSLQGLRNKFPNSFNQEIPPIHYDLVSHLPHFKDVRAVETTVKKANSIIEEVFEAQTITIYDLFLDPQTLHEDLLDQPFLIPTKFSTHMDAVHFSDEANKLRWKYCVVMIDFYYHILNNKNWEQNFLDMLDHNGLSFELNDSIAILFLHAMSLNEPKKYQQFLEGINTKVVTKKTGKTRAKKR